MARGSSEQLLALAAGQDRRQSARVPALVPALVLALLPLLGGLAEWEPLLMVLAEHSVRSRKAAATAPAGTP